MTNKSNPLDDAMGIFGNATVGPESWIAVTCRNNVFQDIAFHETEAAANAYALDFLKPSDRADALKTLKFNRNLTVGGWNVAVRAVNLPTKPYSDVFEG
jgi:hypothetical protein